MGEATAVDVRPVDAPACELGESALWDPGTGRLYWVDIIGRAVYWLDWAGGWVGSLSTLDMVGCVALRRSGGLVAALRHGVVLVDVSAGTVTPVRSVEADRPGNRFNDGAVDPAGRFWFGSMDTAERRPTGALYRLDGARRVERVLTGFTCSNGPAFSPDGRVMYHVDSPRQRITAHEFDPFTGQVGAARVFASDEADPWFPDGVTVDAEGFVWSCKWNGWRVVRYAPDGTVDRVLRLPVPRPTRCALAGPDRAVLAVTTARVGLSAAERAAAPLSGRVLLVDPDAVGAVGRVEPGYAG